MRTILIGLIKVYQYAISPYFASHCRFDPTCSSYAVTAIRKHGAVFGLWLAIKRIFRCHPWHPGGYDPVPEKTKKV